MRSNHAAVILQVFLIEIFHIFCVDLVLINVDFFFSGCRALHAAAR
jgi:hypothetical protein